MSPFLQWNQSRNVTEITSKFPIRFKNYYEPFLRSGEIFFNLYNNGRIFEKAHLSSSDRNLITAYQAVRDEPERLQKMILRYCENNSKQFFENMKHAVATPSAYIYVNRAETKPVLTKSGAVFNDGKWRQSQFIDRNKQISKDVGDIDRCSRYMNRWCQWVFHTDWEASLTNANEGDVILLEPPPIPFTSDARIDYPLNRGGNQWPESNYIYLRNYIEQLKAWGCLVYMIQTNTPATERIFGKPKWVIDGEWIYGP